MWGSDLADVKDVFQVFTCYISGENNASGAKVSHFLSYLWSIRIELVIFPFLMQLHNHKLHGHVCIRLPHNINIITF